MKIVKPSVEVIFWAPEEGGTLEEGIEKAARTCYKSEGKIKEGSADKLIRKLRNSGHHAMLEFGYIMARIVTDRGVANELVRHRLASFAQESTRYVKYADVMVNIVSEDDIIMAYESGFSMKRISEKSGDRYTEWDIYKVLKNNCIKRRNLGNTGNVKHDFFNVIDTVEKAYLLGFIFADGSVHYDTNCISITQNNNISWYLIQMVQEFIKDKVCYYKDRNCHQILWCSEEMVCALRDKGVIKNKTYDVGEKECDLLWQSVPDNLKFDFLRGFLDGDGGIRFFVQNNKGKTKSFCADWAGPKWLLDRISDWLFDKYNYRRNPKHIKNKLYRIFVSGYENGILLCNDLYNNFKFPFGHPVKTSRAFGELGLNRDFNFSVFGNSKFEVLLPPTIKGSDIWIWAQGIKAAEDAYGQLLELGAKPQTARSVLPIGLKTEIVIGANPREWRHIFKMRCDKHAHPMIRSIMIEILLACRYKYPAVFDDFFDDLPDELIDKWSELNDKTMKETIEKYVVDKT